MVTIYLNPRLVKVAGSCGEKEVPVCNKACGSSKCKKARDTGKCPSRAKGNLSECFTYRFIDFSVSKLKTVPMSGGVVEIPNF